MTATDEPTTDPGLRRTVEAELERLLARRTPGSRSTVLGAGAGDLEAGRHFLQILAPGGYMTPTWPRRYGGMGLSGPDAEAVAAALACFEAPDLYPWMVGVDLVGPTILAHGSPAQADRWLGGIRSGAEIWCQLFSEPEAGSDLANVSTKAVRDGGGWRVGGSKVWTSRGHYSQWGLLLARSDPAATKHRGITAFGLDMTLPGITVSPLVQMNGDAHFSQVFLDDVHVDDADRIGEPGDGWRVALTCLSHERGALAGGLGVSVGQLLALGASPAVAGDATRRDRLAGDIARLRMIEWGAQRAQAARKAGEPPGAEGSLAKLATNAMVKDVADLAVGAEGPAGATLEGGPDQWQTMWLVAPSLSIRGGTDEVQRNIVGERVLGLPPEPRVDKDRPWDARG